MRDTSINKSMSANPLEQFRAKQSVGVSAWLSRRHLLDTSDLSRQEVEAVVELTTIFQESPAAQTAALLSGVVIANLFYENSTRTRSSFELAGRNLGATVLNLDVQNSSVSKGETLIDTASTLTAMGVQAVVQRHSSSGSAQQLAGCLGDRVQVINAGDGWHAHPTQALLDLFTMLEVKADLSGAKVAIIGDIAHSRVARSNIWLLKLMGADVHVAGPPTLLPADLRRLDITVHNRLEPAIEQCDFIMALRMQAERQKPGLLSGLSEYRKLYRLDRHRLRLAKPLVKILHPGPVNRGVEIADDLVDDPSLSLITRQVANGLVVRMAVLYLLLSRG